MTIAEASTLDTVRTLVVEQLNLPARGDLPGAEDNLWDLGMTSLGCLGLMLAIEDAFAIDLPKDALKESTFRTLGTISAVVDLTRSAAAESR